jgi:hypothetical protein
MRKLSLLLTLGAAIIIGGTGCLKDKGFEAQDYGTQIAEKKAVAFTEGPNSPLVVGVTAQTAPLVVDGPDITLEHPGSAASDVHLTLALKPTLVTDGGYTLLPAGAVTINTLTPTISAGQKLTDVIKFTFTNSGLLDPNLEYGLGLTINAVDNGYIIAGNKRDILYVFTVKNKYDGVYELTLRHDGWQAYGISSGATAVYPADIHIITAGASSVVIDIPDSPNGDLQPAFTGGVGSITGATAFGAASPKFNFDPATDKVTSVTNTYPDDGRGRDFYLDPATTTSGYTPATKRIYVEYFMKQNGRPDQKIWFDLKYLHPR